MATTMKDLGIDKLTVDERLELVFEIWDSIADNPESTRLTDAQRQELQRRLAEHEANPDDVIPWEQVKREALARIQK
jgi:putative addiction module component (TIGR02574 family)